MVGAWVTMVDARKESYGTARHDPTRFFSLSIFFFSFFSFDLSLFLLSLCLFPFVSLFHRMCTSFLSYPVDDMALHCALLCLMHAWQRSISVA